MFLLPGGSWTEETFSPGSLVTFTTWSARLKAAPQTLAPRLADHSMAQASSGGHRQVAVYVGHRVVSLHMRVLPPFSISWS